MSISSLDDGTIETESPQMDFVDLTSPYTSQQHRTSDSPTRRGPELVGKTKFSLTNSPTLSSKKVQFKSEARKSENDPPGLPTEPAAVVETPIVNNTDWLTTTLILAAMELLGRPMTLEELRKLRMETRASNGDAA